MEREFVCVVCPKSCELTVDWEGGALRVAGNQCKRGIGFAEQEAHNPQRILTTTVKLTDGGLLPVRSKNTVKKNDLKRLAERLKTLEVSPPAAAGQVITVFDGETLTEIIASDTVPGADWASI